MKGLSQLTRNEFVATPHKAVKPAIGKICKIWLKKHKTKQNKENKNKTTKPRSSH